MQMKDLAARFLSEADQQKIEACVQEAEQRTHGEIVVMAVSASYHYPTASLLGATALSFPIAIALTPLLGSLVWTGPSNMWIFLGALIPLFLAFHEAVKRIRFLKKLFISGKEMEAEVQEAAGIQFYRKGLYRTREETGVLIYISIFEHKVWVLGDRGINAKIPEEYWKGIVHIIVRAIQEGRPAEGICQAVSKLSVLLEEKFPVRPGDKNELKNLMVGNGSS